MENTSIIVPFDYISKSSSELLVSVYICSMKYFIRSHTEKIYITPDAISYDIFKKIDEEHVSSVRKEFLYLKEIGVLENLKNTETYYITLNNLQKSKKISKRFVVVEFEDIEKILNSKKKNRISLVLHYCRIISILFLKTDNIKYANKFGNISLKYLQKEFGLIRNTTIRMNEALQEMELITWANTGKDEDENSYTTNYYCRFKDLYLLLEFLNMRSNNNIKYANRIRSIKQRMKHIDKYTDEQKAKLQMDIVEVNNRKKWNQEECIDPPEFEEDLPF